MRLVYIPNTPLGECFYDPKSHEGITIINDKAVRITMSHTFDVRTQKNTKDFEVAAEDFRRLIQGSLNGKMSCAEIKEALKI